jgi:hypothetical protein
MDPPAPNGLVGHRHFPFRQQILDVTKTEGEPEPEPYRLLNDASAERWDNPFGELSIDPQRCGNEIVVIRHPTPKTGRRYLPRENVR